MSQQNLRKNLAHIKRKEQEANILLKAFLQEEIDKGELGLEARLKAPLIS